MELTFLYEFVGTFIILYGSAVYGSLPISLALIAIAKSITLGHLNPALTFWYYLSGKIDGIRALLYILSQFAAAVAVFKLYN